MPSTKRGFVDARAMGRYRRSEVARATPARLFRYRGSPLRLRHSLSGAGSTWGSTWGPHNRLLLRRLFSRASLVSRARDPEAGGSNPTARTNLRFIQIGIEALRSTKHGFAMEAALLSSCRETARTNLCDAGPRD